MKQRIRAIRQYLGPLGEYGRPTFAGAVLAKTSGRGGETAKTTPPGYVQGVRHDRGHLIAKAFGGPDDPRNVATQTQWANRGPMLVAERLATSLAEQGRLVYLRVRVLSHGNTALPLGFIVEVWADLRPYLELEFYNA